MYINAIYDADLQNGEGVGVTLCVSGCPIKCPGCFNPEAQNPTFGKRYTSKEEAMIINLLNKEYINHLAIIGGEPLQEQNVMDLAYLCSHIKQLWPHKKIWLWSGYLWEDIYSLAFDMSCSSIGTQQDWHWQNKKNLRNILFSLDILVDGPFVQKQKDITLKWKGSANQRVIDVQQSLRQNLPVLPPPSPILYCK